MIAKLASSTSVHQSGRATNGLISSSDSLKSIDTNGGGNNQRGQLLSASFVANTIASSQSKKKRAKILDLLLNTNWSKQSQQAGQLMKLNKLLLVCDANFIDEKSGESPLSLIVGSQQINYTNTPNHHQLMMASNLMVGQSSSSSLSHHQSYTQSASLFNLQATCSSASTSSLLLSSQQQNSHMLLQQTNIADLVHSKAPLVERLILLFIKSGAQIDIRNTDGRSPLHVAAIKSNLWALKTLLDLGASQHIRDNNGLSPLYNSILHKADLKVTQLLLNNLSNSRTLAPGGSCGGGPARNQFAFVSARPLTQHATSSALSSNGNLANDDGNEKENQQTTTTSIGLVDQHGWQEVHQASKLGLDAHLDKLLFHGCDINAKISGSGNTPLHVAAINDRLNCAKVLLMRGADKTITNNSHQTAHQVAVISNNMDLAEFIAEHDDSKVIPFNERHPPQPAPGQIEIVSTTINSHQRASTRSSISNNTIGSSMASSQSSANFGKSFQSSAANNNATSSLTRHANIVQPMPQLHQVQRPTTQTAISQNPSRQQQHMNTLTLDTRYYNNNNQQQISSTSADNQSPSPQLPMAQQHHQQSLHTMHLSINANSNTVAANNQQLNIQVNNISPCLSQRSCATSNTTNTSSSGVCCDADANSAEELPAGECNNNINNDTAQMQRSHHHHQQNQLVNSQSSHSNITVVAINGNTTTESINTTTTMSANNTLLSSSVSSNQLNHHHLNHMNPTLKVINNNNSNNNNNNINDRTKVNYLHAMNTCENLIGNSNSSGQVDDDDEDVRSSDSSSNGLYSLMSDERPIFAGSIVKATSDYQSGDPNHLQLHVGDLIEVLECKPELLQGGQLPRLANKPMLYGRRQVDQSACGLFPSFCVRRAKQQQRQQPSPGQRIVAPKQTTSKAITNSISTTDFANGNSNIINNNNNNSHRPNDVVLSNSGSISNSANNNNYISGDGDQQHNEQNHQISTAAAQQSMSGGGSDMNMNVGGVGVGAGKQQLNNHALKLNYKEFQVTLTKSNEGFGFVLRGARIDPATLTTTATLAGNSNAITMNDGGGGSNKIVIDESLMAANNLLSLQYLDEIEPASVADRAGLKRGDFLVAVNQQDVRLCSHEQVVHLIRQSGNQVNLTIATPISHTHSNIQWQQQQQQQQPKQHNATPDYSSKTIARVKPEPPKRDPTTTLTRNRAQRIKSMLIQPTQPQIGQQLHQQQRLRSMMMSQDATGCDGSFPQQQTFDANKPLPSAPSNGAAAASATAAGLMSPTGSLNLLQRSASITNNSHFNSTQSLSTGCGDSQSNLSVSTVNSVTSADGYGQPLHQHQPVQQQQHRLLSPQHDDLNQSSTTNSTTTLTTVATTKPRVLDQQHQAGEHSIANSNNNRFANRTNSYQSAVITTTTKRDSIASNGLSPTITSPEQSSENQAANGGAASFANNRHNYAAHHEKSSTPSQPVSALPPPPPPLPLSLAQVQGQQQQPPLTMPPPPPPLPDFSAAPSSAMPDPSRLQQRRTSAPAVNIGFPSAERLMRTRESLAAVKVSRPLDTGAAGSTGSANQSAGPTEIGAVAAACAAAANNRLQRQKQKEEEEQQQLLQRQQSKAGAGESKGKVQDSAGGVNQSNDVSSGKQGQQQQPSMPSDAAIRYTVTATAATATTATTTTTTTTDTTLADRCEATAKQEPQQQQSVPLPATDQSHEKQLIDERTAGANVVSASKSEHQLAVAVDSADKPSMNAMADAGKQLQDESPKRPAETNANAVIGSATLGRKSSALIIQQPAKTQQSQTLRAAKPNKQRPSIPSYEQPSLPPPPPLPPTMNANVNVNQELVIANGTTNVNHTCYQQQQSMQADHMLRSLNQQHANYHAHPHHHHHHHVTTNKQGDQPTHQQQYQQQQTHHQPHHSHHHQQQVMRNQQSQQQAVKEIDALLRSQRLSHDLGQLKSQEALINQQRQQQLLLQQQRICQEKYNNQDQHQCNAAVAIKGPTVASHQVVLADNSRDIRRLAATNHHPQQVAHIHPNNSVNQHHQQHHHHAAHSHHNSHHHHHHHHHHEQQQYIDNEAAMQYQMRSHQLQHQHRLPGGGACTIAASGDSPAQQRGPAYEHHHSHHPHHHHHHHSHAHHLQQQQQQQVQHQQPQHLLQHQRTLAAAATPQQQQYNLQQQQKYLERHMPIGYAVSNMRNN